MAAADNALKIDGDYQSAKDVKAKALYMQEEDIAREDELEEEDGELLAQKVLHSLKMAKEDIEYQEDYGDHGAAEREAQQGEIGHQQELEAAQQHYHYHHMDYMQG